MDSLFESVEKRGVLLVGLIYALGVVIVNFHLAEYDIAGQLGLLRPIYLFAGVYGAVPIALASIFWWCLFQASSKEMARRVRIQKWGVTVAILAFMVVALILFNRYIAAGYPTVFNWPMWIFVATTFILGLLSYMLTLGPWKVTKTSDLKRYVPSSILVLLIWLVYGFAFSTSIYNRVPASWGGTRSTYIDFILDPTEKELKTELQRAGVHFLPGTSRITMTKLIIQTDSDYVCVSVTQHKQSATQTTHVLPFYLKRDVVKALIYKSYNY